MSLGWQSPIITFPVLPGLGRVRDAIIFMASSIPCGLAGWTSLMNKLKVPYSYFPSVYNRRLCMRVQSCLVLEKLLELTRNVLDTVSERAQFPCSCFQLWRSLGPSAYNSCDWKCWGRNGGNALIRSQRNTLESLAWKIKHQ